MSLSHILSIVGFCLTISLGWATAIIYANQKKSRKNYADALKAPHPTVLGLRSLYREKLEAALNRLDERLGTPLSAKAFSFHLTLALVYAIALFAVSWAMGGSGKIGAIESACGNGNGHGKGACGGLNRCASRALLYILRPFSKDNCVVI